MLKQAPLSSRSLFPVNTGSPLRLHHRAVFGIREARGDGCGIPRPFGTPPRPPPGRANTRCLQITTAALAGLPHPHPNLSKSTCAVFKARGEDHGWKTTPQIVAPGGGQCNTPTHTSLSCVSLPASKLGCQNRATRFPGSALESVLETCQGVGFLPREKTEARREASLSAFWGRAFGPQLSVSPPPQVPRKPQAQRRRQQLPPCPASGNWRKTAPSTGGMRRTGAAWR